VNPRPVTGTYSRRRKRTVYLIAFLLLLLSEVLIALFVRDAFLRPYGGDILVTVLLCCFVRIFLPARIRLLPLYVFLFAVCVETAQALDVVALLGLENNAFFRTLIGTSFSWPDILCYGAGCICFAFAEAIPRFRTHTCSDKQKR